MSAIDFSKHRFAAIDLFPVAGILLTSLMIAALGLASLRVDSALQASTSALLVAALFLMRQASGRDFVRVVFLLVSLFIAVRYFSWRVQFSLRYEGLPSFLAALLLFAAECYGFMMFTLTAFINRLISFRMNCVRMAGWREQKNEAKSAKKSSKP